MKSQRFTTEYAAVVLIDGNESNRKVKANSVIKGKEKLANMLIDKYPKSDLQLISFIPLGQVAL